MDDTDRINSTLIAFESIAWSSPLPGMRIKQAEREGHRIRLIELDESFVEPDWCQAGHVGYVIAGSLEIHFSGKAVQFQTGDALCIPPGESTRHKARSIQGVTLLFVVDLY